MHNTVPGSGPFLSYKQVNNQVILKCRVDSVFPEPDVDLMWTPGIGMNTNKDDNFRFTDPEMQINYLRPIQFKIIKMFQLRGNDHHHPEGEPLHGPGGHDAGHLPDLGLRGVALLHLSDVHPQHGCGQN